MLRVGARGIDIAIVVRSAALAGVSLARRVGAHDALISHARRGMAPQILGGIGDAAIIDDAFLHRALDLLALAGELALIQRPENADRGVQAGAGVADRQTGFDWAAVGLAGDRHRAAGCLSDHVKGEEVLVGAIVAEALNRDVDDARVDLAHDVVTKAEPLDDPGSKILDKDIALLHQPAQNGATLLMLEIGGDAALVGVEQHEVMRVDPLLVGRGAASLLALGRLLDLDHLGAEPGQGQGAGCPGLKLGQVHHSDAVQGAALHRCGLGGGAGRWVVRHMIPPGRDQLPPRAALIPASIAFRAVARELRTLPSARPDASADSQPSLPRRQRFPDAVAGEQQPGSAVDVGDPADRPLANRPRRSRTPCSACFIRSRSGIANSYNDNPAPAQGADARIDIVRLWQLFGCQCRKSGPSVESRPSSATACEADRLAELAGSRPGRAG